MMKTSWGGISHYPRRSLEIVQESLELNQHRLREKKGSSKIEKLSESRIMHGEFARGEIF